MGIDLNFYRAERARKAAAIVALINISGMLMNLAMNTEQVDPQPVIFSVAIGIFVLFITLVTRRPHGTGPMYALYILNTVAVTIALFLLDPIAAASSSNWVPFQTSKLAVFIIATTAPHWSLGLFGIWFHAGAAILNGYLMTENSGIEFATEPLATFSFATAALLVLFYRVSLMRFVEKTITETAEAQSLKRLAAEFTAVHGKMNRSLQAIETHVKLLRHCGNDTKKVEQILQDLDGVNQYVAEIPRKIATR